MKKRAAGIFSDVLRRVPMGANIESLRDGALDVFSVEISRMLSRLDFQKLVDNTIQGYTIKIEAKLELVPKGRKLKKAGKT